MNRYRYEEMLGEDGVYTMTSSSTKVTAACATEGEQRVLPIRLGPHSAYPTAFIPIPRKPPATIRRCASENGGSRSRLPPDWGGHALSGPVCGGGEGVDGDDRALGRRLRRPVDEREPEGNGSGGGRKDEHHNHSC
ncbi:hypothetical protein ABZP36_027581 [Zizania latifolia]